MLRGKLDAAELRNKFLESRLGELRIRLADSEETRTRLDEARRETRVAMEAGEGRVFEATEKIKEAQAAKRELERRLVRAQAESRESEERVSVLEAQLQDFSEQLADQGQKLAREVAEKEEKIARLEECHSQILAVNKKVSEFAGLMEQLVEENQRLKFVIEDSAKERKVRKEVEANFMRKTQTLGFNNDKKTTY